MWEVSNPSQGHQQADKYSIPIPTLPCKAKNKRLIANRQSSCPQLSGYEVSLVPDGSHDCQEMLLLNLLKIGESLQGVAFCLVLGFISKTLGEGRNLPLAGGDLEFPRLVKGVRQEGQDFLNQRLDPGCCWSIPFRCAMWVAVCAFARCSHQQRNKQKTKDPQSIHALNPWRVRKIQFP